MKDRISEEPWWSPKRNQWGVTIVKTDNTKTFWFNDLTKAADFILENR